MPSSGRSIFIYNDDGRDITVAKVSLNMPAPVFNLKDFKGAPVSLSDYTNKFNILLVFNRGFT